MIVDLHSHYPMRVVSDFTPQTPRRLATKRLQSPTLAERFRALVLRLASMFFSHRFPWSPYRVTPQALRKGQVGVALSVMTEPFDEFDLSKPYGWNPEPEYYKRLVEHLTVVEDEVATHRDLRMVKTRQELDDAIRDGVTALVHCVEGGFSLGDRPQDIARNVADLRRRGVFYVTVAHLIFRQVATAANAFPFLEGDAFARNFPQPPAEGLTERGRAAVTAMVENRVVVDIAHMRQDALDETFALLEELDPGHEVPVINTHAGYRFGEQDYMLTAETIRQIQRRNGVVGLILAQHQLLDGMPEKETRSFEDSRRVLFKHIDKIAKVTGGYEHVAIGTDLDGFIKPTLSGLENAGDLAKLERALDERYKGEAALIKSENALRVLRQVMA
jgi:microsomal dipeptidase-like Zn-dependent dipeptidase